MQDYDHTFCLLRNGEVGLKSKSIQLFCIFSRDGYNLESLGRQNLICITSRDVGKMKLNKTGAVYLPSMYMLQALRIGL